MSNSKVVLDVRVVTGTGGGPDKTILNSPRFLNDCGYSSWCAYLHPPGDAGFEKLKQQAAACQAPLIAIPDRGPWDMRVVSRLARVCKEKDVSIWHGHDYKSNALGLLVRRFWPMRLVTTVHGWVKHTRRTPLYYAVDRLCLRYYESVICVSRDLLNRCVEAHVPADRCKLVENGVDTQQYRRQLSRPQARERLGWPTTTRVIGGVGRLSPEKGFDDLLRAFAMLRERGLDVGLAIVGDGEDRGSLEQLATRLGVSDRVRWLGYRGDVIDLYQALDVFCLSSLREGLPNVVLEALALEVPVVATRINGVVNLILDGQNGLLVEPRNPDGLSAALERVLADDALSRSLAESGRATVEQNYSFAQRMQKVRAIYDDLVIHD